ncbi:MAG: hypothetical protein AAF558_14725 [Verrucomicrobiota bacterium]
MIVLSGRSFQEVDRREVYSELIFSRKLRTSGLVALAENRPNVAAKIPDMAAAEPNNTLRRNHSLEVMS